MPLTRSFRETIKEQLAKDDFRREFLREAVSNMIAGDLEMAKSVPREYINGTLGFPALGEALCSARLLTCGFDLFAEDAAEGFFELGGFPFDVLAEGFV